MQIASTHNLIGESNFAKAAEFASFEDASLAAQVFEHRHGFDTRVDSTADGYVVRVLDDEGDHIGWLEEGTIDITTNERAKFGRE